MLSSLVNSAPIWFVPLTIILTLGLFRHVLYAAWFSPLCQIPRAHPLASWTSLWILYRRLRGHGNKTLYDAHSRYGDIVRVAPNEVSVNSIEGLKTIYVGNFDKHEWYSHLAAYNGVPNAVSCLDGRSHADSRRLFTNVYSKSFIQNSSIVKDIFEEMTTNRILPELMKSADCGIPLEIIGFGGGIGFDFVTAFLFGLEQATNMIRDMDYRNKYFSNYEATKPYMIILAEMFGTVSFLQRFCIGVLPNHVSETFESMGRRVSEMCTSAKNQISHSPAIVYDHAVRNFGKSDVPWPIDDKITSEMMDQVLAGFETTATTLAYLMYELSENNVLQLQLRNEIKTLGDPTDFRNVDRLPLLNAIVYETIRRYPAAAGSLPRVVPADGVRISGFFVPGNVRIGSSAYCLHRNEVVFPHPTKWDPLRWLDASTEELIEMNRWFWGFGSGARMCLGNHFVLQELKAVTVAIYTNFETVVAYAGDMTPEDAFIGRPSGNRLDIKFRSLDK